MKLEDTIWERIHAFPTLNHSTLDKTRADILYQLFLTTGNGYVWTDSGYMTSVSTSINKEPRGDLELVTIPGVPGFYAETAPEYGSETHEKRHFNPSFFASDPKPPDAALNGKGYFLPTSVQEDWLEGILEAYSLARSYYLAHEFRYSAQITLENQRRIIDGFRYDYEAGQFTRV